jgi:sensor domain CHASE-containing protein
METVEKIVFLSVVALSWFALGFVIGRDLDERRRQKHQQRLREAAEQITAELSNQQVATTRRLAKALKKAETMTDAEYLELHKAAKKIERRTRKI